MTSACLVASAAVRASKPSFSASSPLGVPWSSPTITLTPLSRRFWAWAWPWLP